MSVCAHLGRAFVDVAHAQRAAAQKENKTAATHPDKTSSQTGPHACGCRMWFLQLLLTLLSQLRFFLRHG